MTKTHELAAFRSAEPSLDQWLRDRALTNMAIGATRTYVIFPLGSRRVIGYYVLATGQIREREVLGAMRRSIPRHMPAVILGRLAIDEAWRGRGLGRALLFDAVDKSLRAGRVVSARLMIAHAISADAEAFYWHHGFARLPVETRRLRLIP